MSKRRLTAGFTLVEVMVAILIVAMVLPPLLSSYARQADDIAYLRDKSIAQWVASNKLEEARLILRRTQQLFQGERSGVTLMGEREWFWWMEAQATQVEDFYRLDIRVADKEEDQATPLYTLTGFVASESDGEG